MDQCIRQRFAQSFGREVELVDRRPPPIYLHCIKVSTLLIDPEQRQSTIGICEG